MLSEEEAGSYWGPGVFLTSMLENHSYSLTARVAYWAGGIDPQEREEPLEIKATGFSDLAALVQKAACIQATYERDTFRKSLMPAPVGPARLTLLICGLLIISNYLQQTPKIAYNLASAGLSTQELMVR